MSDRPDHGIPPAGIGGAWQDWARRPAELTRPPDPDQDPEGYRQWRLQVLAAYGRLQRRSAA